MKKDTVLTLAQRKERGALFCDEGLTEQSHKDSCDINVIMAGYNKTGLVPVCTDQVPLSGDFSQVSDFHTALNVVIQAQESFDLLPAEWRKEFNHDPSEFLAALDDPAQKARLLKAGVIVEPKAAEGASGGSTPPEEGSGT